MAPRLPLVGARRQLLAAYDIASYFYKERGLSKYFLVVYGVNKECNSQSAADRRHQ